MYEICIYIYKEYKSFIQNAVNEVLWIMKFDKNNLFFIQKLFITIILRKKDLKNVFKMVAQWILSYLNKKSSVKIANCYFINKKVL